MTGKRQISFRDGTPGIVRPITPSDREAFVEGFELLSEESRFHRFFFTKKTLTEEEIARFENPDGINHLAYGVAALEDDGREKPIAVGHCFRQIDEPDLAEIAVVTADLWQGSGAGSELVRSLGAASLEIGINRWLAIVMADNFPMRRILDKYGTKLQESSAGSGVIEAIYEINESSIYSLIIPGGGSGKE